MQENTCLYSYSSLYFYSFLGKTSPYIFIQAYTCIRDCRVLLAFQMTYFSIFIPGALPTSTKVCLVQKYPFGQDVMFYNERSFGTIVKKVLHTYLHKNSEVDMLQK